MDTPDVRFSRISKLFVDRDEVALDAVLAQRQGYSITLSCGDDVGQSYTLQLAILTAANIAGRCFPGAVRVELSQRLAAAPLLLWPSLKQTLGQALLSLLGPQALMGACHFTARRTVIFGNASDDNGSALRLTFDGWIAKVGPVRDCGRLPEREYCSLVGILAAALAVSELFLAFGEISLAATRRTVALSLWRPDLDVVDPSALGIPMEFLPRDVWMLGLGHLGNAYLWSLATLPYRDPGETKIFLNDFDEIEPDNVETSVLFNERNIGRYKTRTCGAWLEQRGFRTRFVERPFDEHFRCRPDEPKLAFCGFDSNSARRYIATARFDRVVESGLGGNASVNCWIPCKVLSLAVASRTREVISASAAVAWPSSAKASLR
ncbi:MAG TPA: ThiF family adenylyltransferase [Terriglobales bacterium]|nr:ThiF family adenylyltransferase [Terriglobales bacterium]